MKRILILIILIIPVISQAQQWKRQRRELIVGVGASNFLGDLGGANQIGTYYLRDLEFNQTRSNLLLAYRFRYSQNIYFKGNFNYGRVSGDDLLTQEPARNARRLNFRTNLWELSGTFEYAITEERIKGRYIRGQSRFPVNIYTILGLGITFFNPKGQFRGDPNYVQGAVVNKWYSLHDLHTEGQNLPGGSKPYKLWTIVIPVGIGLKYPITNTWHIGMEYKMMKTFTDYIDDAGGFYYNNDDIKKNNGELAAYFADPSIEYRRGKAEKPTVFSPRPNLTGQDKRANFAKNDTYLYGTVYVAYKFIKGANKSRVKF
jgi:hypothetical protein